MSSEASAHPGSNPEQVMGMMNMLGLAKRVKARILQASTSEVHAPRTATRTHAARSRASEPPRPAEPSELSGEEHGAAAPSHAPPGHGSASCPLALPRLSQLPARVRAPQVYLSLIHI